MANGSRMLQTNVFPLFFLHLQLKTRYLTFYLHIMNSLLKYYLRYDEVPPWLLFPAFSSVVTKVITVVETVVDGKVVQSSQTVGADKIE